MGGAGANVIDPNLTSGYGVPEMTFNLSRSSGEALQKFEKPQVHKIFRSKYRLSIFLEDWGRTWRNFD